ncbi:hypothetical protein LXA43DRAFT_511898 [Ganoderma leucocontextum]|nr:hypothetical protein LXA43DRAFT_511898 [Ganoderma leucocontextum]
MGQCQWWLWSAIVNVVDLRAPSSSARSRISDSDRDTPPPRIPPGRNCTGRAACSCHASRPSSSLKSPSHQTCPPRDSLLPWQVSRSASQIESLVSPRRTYIVNMASGFDIWGVIASVIGLLSLFQFIAAVVKSRLPRERLRTFNDIVEETEGLLWSVEEEGLFDDDGGRYLSSAKMKIAKCLQGDAFAAQTLMQEIRQWWNGLSGEIMMCCADLKALRAQVSTTSNERRQTLTQRQKDLAAGDGQLGMFVARDPGGPRSPIMHELTGPVCH